MTKPKNLTNETFQQEVLEAEGPVFVDFWAPWCGPCLMMSPILDDLASEYEGKLKVTKLDVEVPQHRELAIRYQIQGIPNMKVFYQGKVIQDLIGYRTKERLFNEIEIILERIEELTQGE